MKLLEIIHGKEEVLNEGALTTFLTKVFKGFKQTVGATAETLLQKAIDDVAKGTGKAALPALRKNTSYRDAIKSTIAEASRAQYGQSFDEIFKSNKNAATKLSNDVQAALEKELVERAALSKVIIDKDVKAATSSVTKTQKGVNTGKATQQDLKLATKELVSNTKLQSRYAEMQKAIAGMDKLSAQKIANMLKKDAKVITGTGTSVSGGVKGNTQIFTGGKFFTMSKEQLKKFPGTVKRVIVNNPIKSLLAGAGLGIAAVYYFLGGDTDAVIVTDENGNDVQDIGGEWDMCIQDLIKNKEGVLVKSSNGQIYVKVVTSEYPNGVLFYSNGRVMDVANKKMGSWKCKVGKVAIQEQAENEISVDVETMIDLLDFPVTQNNLISAGTLLKKYVDNGKGKEFLSLYKDTGYGGGDLSKTLNNITTTQAKSVQAKRYLRELINQISTGSSPVKTGGTNTKIGIGNVEITWDGKKAEKGGLAPAPVPSPSKSKYHDCSKKDVNKESLEFGCKSSQIKELQICLGLPTKYQTGNFGPITMKALGGVKTITKEVYDKVKSNCKQPTTTDNTQSQVTSKPISSIDMGKKDLSLSTQIDTKNIKIPNLSSAQSPEGLYNALANANVISSLIDDDGNMRRRIVYKGPDLTDDQLSSLKSYLTSKGYDDRFSQVDHRKGEKYVFVNRG